jgi:hypothetical protein
MNTTPSAQPTTEREDASDLSAKSKSWIRPEMTEISVLEGTANAGGGSTDSLVQT